MAWMTIKKIACWIILLNTIPGIVVQLQPYRSESSASNGFKSIAIMVMLLSLASLALLRLTGKGRSQFWRFVEFVMYPVAIGVALIYDTGVIRGLFETNQTASLMMLSSVSISYITSLAIMLIGVFLKK